MTDEELVGEIQKQLLAKRHEQRAMELEDQLWTRQEPRVRWLAGQFCNGKEKAVISEDDLVQEAHIKFHERIMCFNLNRGVLLWTWLERVLGNLFIGILRKEKRQQGQQEGQYDNDENNNDEDSEPKTMQLTEALSAIIPDANSPDPVKETLLNDLRNAVSNCCNKTVAGGYPAKKVMAFKMYYLSETKRTMQEIARDMNHAVGWVHKVHQTKDAFGKAFARLYPDIVRQYKKQQKNNKNERKGNKVEKARPKHAEVSLVEGDERR